MKRWKEATILQKRNTKFDACGNDPKKGHPISAMDRLPLPLHHSATDQEKMEGLHPTNDWPTMSQSNEPASPQPLDFQNAPTTSPVQRPKQEAQSVSGQWAVGKALSCHVMGDVLVSNPIQTSLHHHLRSSFYSPPLIQSSPAHTLSRR